MITKDVKLHIIYRFRTLPYIVSSDDGLFQLEHFSNKRMKQFRKIELILVGGSFGYRINRKFYSRNSIKKLAYKYHSEIVIGNEVVAPF